MQQQMVANDERATDLIFNTMQEHQRAWPKTPSSQQVVELEQRAARSSRKCANWWPAHAAGVVYETGDPDAWHPGRRVRSRD